MIHINPSLMQRIHSQGIQALSQTRWVMRIFSENDDLLGESNPFGFKPGGNAESVSIQIRSTGLAARAELIEAGIDGPHLIRTATKLIKKMSDQGNSNNEIEKALHDLLMKTGKMDLEVGLAGEDLNLSSVFLTVGSTLHIDSMNFTEENK